MTKTTLNANEQKVCDKIIKVGVPKLQYNKIYYARDLFQAAGYDVVSPRICIILRRETIQGKTGLRMAGTLSEEGYYRV